MIILRYTMGRSGVLVHLNVHFQTSKFTFLKNTHFLKGVLCVLMLVKRVILGNGSRCDSCRNVTHESFNWVINISMYLDNKEYIQTGEFVYCP